MSKKETRSIAYLFEEMDPSEKLEFERDLEKDNNLLIEVETLRNVSERLDNIQVFEPPRHLVESICTIANQHNGTERKSYWKPTLYATAALILLGMTSGIFLLDNKEQNSSDSSGEAAISSPFLYENTLTPSSNVSSSGRVTPWVDNNEVIHFHDRLQASESAAIDSIFRHSFQKLTPVTDPAETRSYQRNLHLTGNRR